MPSPPSSSRRRRPPSDAAVVKVCIACKRSLSRINETTAYRCREELGHIAPNWDAPGADEFFCEKATADDVAASVAFDATDEPKRAFKKQKKTTPLLPEKAVEERAIVPKNQIGLYDRLERLDATASSSGRRAVELRKYGVPFVWINVDLGASVGFAQRWVTSQGEIDTQAFKNDVINARAPLLRYDASFSARRPIREFGDVSEFIENEWKRHDASVYLHQWQFPLATSIVANTLIEACGLRPLSNLPGLEDDFLCSWLERTNGASALQYLFLGTTGTHSRLHIDPGGLDLLIAPLTGCKRFTLIHREDAFFVPRSLTETSQADSHTSSTFPSSQEDTDDNNLDQDNKTIDWQSSPTLPLARKWCDDIVPGEVLCMPEGTLHSVHNMEPSLSYHRFHLDRHNLSGFWRALVDGDSPGIRPAEILWNATHSTIDRLDALSDDPSTHSPKNQDALLGLKALRDVIQALMGEFLTCNQDSGSQDEEDRVRGCDFDWASLLSDVENSLDNYQQSAKSIAQKKNKKRKSTTSRASSRRRCEPDPRDEARARGHSFDAHTVVPLFQTLSESIDKNDIVAIRFYRKRQRARVLQVVEQAEMVKVHYISYSSEYDELIPISDCHPPQKANPSNSPHRERAFIPKPEAQCRVPWGPQRQMYSARILELYSGPAFKVHYLAIGREWDQWVSPHAILRKLQA